MDVYFSFKQTLIAKVWTRNWVGHSTKYNLNFGFILIVLCSKYYMFRMRLVCDGLKIKKYQIKSGKLVKSVIEFVLIS